MKSKQLTTKQAAKMLWRANDILLLCHQYPDGDTIGSATGLCLALQHLGKRVRIACNDPFPPKYAYMTAPITVQEFEPQFICAVDVADNNLLGSRMEMYADKVDLCIDHHGTNTGYAANLLLNAEDAATTMLIFRLLRYLRVPLTKDIAACLYTGMVTDTGCFKYSNTTPQTHQMAAACMQTGIPYATINRVMFDTKSRARIELEKMALDRMSFHFNGRCAIMTITNEMIAKSGATEDDLEGLPPLPRQIEGVWVGVTLRERADGGFKVSIRTDEQVNAATLCGLLGGGGHPAAGCRIDLPLHDAIDKLLQVIGDNVPIKE